MDFDYRGAFKAKVVEVRVCEPAETAAAANPLLRLAVGSNFNEAAFGADGRQIAGLDFGRKCAPYSPNSVVILALSLYFRCNFEPFSLSP